MIQDVSFNGFRDRRNQQKYDQTLAPCRNRVSVAALAAPQKTLKHRGFLMSPLGDQRGGAPPRRMPPWGSSPTNSLLSYRMLAQAAINSPMLPDRKKNADGRPAQTRSRTGHRPLMVPAYVVMRLYWPKDDSPSIYNGTWRPATGTWPVF